MTVQITATQFHTAEGVDDWRCLYHVTSAYFRAGSLAEGITLVDAIGRLTDEDYVTVDLRHDGVTVNLLRRDVALARRISAAAAELHLPAEPARVQLLSICLDALDAPAILPFWQAILGYDPIGDDYLTDPARRHPGLDFQRMDRPRPQRNRIHLDIAVPHDQAQTRITAALAAGGHLVSDEHAPKWWTLADTEGNEACIATWAGRD
jgi:4a-hydroxytetrahydrobiopterin dehydratase